MLEIFNDLSNFIEDNYQELGVREYARKRKVSPPTASKLLTKYEKIGILKKRQEKTQLLYRANRENKTLAAIAAAYWTEKLTPLIKTIEEEAYPSAIILFGSLTKLETTTTSDIDLAILSKLQKELPLEKFEKSLKRKIQIFTFKDITKIPEDLRKNIINGHTLLGTIPWT